MKKLERPWIVYDALTFSSHCIDTGGWNCLVDEYLLSDIDVLEPIEYIHDGLSYDLDIDVIICHNMQHAQQSF